MESNDNIVYKKIGKLTIENVDYPVFFNNEGGKTYYLKNEKYFFIDWPGLINPSSS